MYEVSNIEKIQDEKISVNIFSNTNSSISEDSNEEELQTEPTSKDLVKNKNKLWSDISKIFKFVILFFLPLILNCLFLLIPLFPKTNYAEEKVSVDFYLYLIMRFGYILPSVILSYRLTALGLRHSKLDYFFPTILISAIITTLDLFLTIIQINNPEFPKWLRFSSNFIDSLLLYVFTGIGGYMKCLDKTNFVTQNDYYNIEDRFLWGGYKKENSRYSRHFVIVMIIIHTLFIMNYLFCSYSVFYFEFSTHSLKFPIFWFISKIFSNLTKKVSKNLMIEIPTALICLILPTYLFYAINYRIIFFDKDLSVFAGMKIVIQSVILEFFYFFFPLTNCYKKLRNYFARCSFIFKFFFSEGEKEYIEQVTSLTYFLKLISITWSLLGTISTFFMVSLTSNKLVFNDHTKDLGVIAIRSLLVFCTEIFTFLTIELCYQKLFRISAWNNFLKIFSSEYNMLIFILWPLHILQDPIIARLNNTSVY